MAEKSGTHRQGRKLLPRAAPARTSCSSWPFTGNVMLSSSSSSSSSSSRASSILLNCVPRDHSTDVSPTLVVRKGWKDHEVGRRRSVPVRHFRARMREGVKVRERGPELPRGRSGCEVRSRETPKRGIFGTRDERTDRGRVCLQGRGPWRCRYRSRTGWGPPLVGPYIATTTTVRDRVPSFSSLRTAARVDRISDPGTYESQTTGFPRQSRGYNHRIRFMNSHVPPGILRILLWSIVLINRSILDVCEKRTCLNERLLNRT